MRTGRTESGGYAIEEGGVWREVDEETYAAAGMGRGERLARGLGDMVIDRLSDVTFGRDPINPLAWGARNALELGRTLGLGPAERALGAVDAIDPGLANDPRQAARAGIDPLVEYGAQFAPEVLGGVTAAPGLARGAGRAALGAGRELPGVEWGVEMFRAARESRAMQRETAERLAGAEEAERLRRAGLGVRRDAGTLAEDPAAGRGAELAWRDRQGLSAEATDPDLVEFGTDRVRRNLMTPDELEAYSAPGMPLAPSQRGALLARNRDEYDFFNRVSEEADLMSSTERGGLQTLAEGAVPDMQAIRTQQRAALDQTVARELGLPSEDIIDVNSIGSRMTEISAEMDAIWKDAGPIFGDELLADVDRIVDGQLLSVDGEHMARRVREEIERKVDPKAGNQISGQDQSKLRNMLTEKILNAAKNQSDTEIVDLLGRVRGALDGRAQTNMEGGRYGGEVERLQELRHQWKLSLALTRQRGVIDADGRINAGTFVRSLETMDQLYRTGRERSPFMKYLRTMEQVLARRNTTGGSQTASRLSRSRAWSRLTQGGAAAGAGALGLGALF